MTGDSKVPSIMYYDEDGTLKEAGPSAASERAADDAELEGWYKVELHVYP